MFSNIKSQNQMLSKLDEKKYYLSIDTYLSTSGIDKMYEDIFSISPWKHCCR